MSKYSLIHRCWEGSETASWFFVLWLVHFRPEQPFLPPLDSQIFHRGCAKSQKPFVWNSSTEENWTYQHNLTSYSFLCNLKSNLKCFPHIRTFLRTSQDVSQASSHIMFHKYRFVLRLLLSCNSTFSFPCVSFKLVCLHRFTSIPSALQQYGGFQLPGCRQRRLEHLKVTWFYLHWNIQTRFHGKSFLKRS